MITLIVNSVKKEDNLGQIKGYLLKKCSLDFSGLSYTGKLVVIFTTKEIRINDPKNQPSITVPFPKDGLVFNFEDLDQLKSYMESIDSYVLSIEQEISWLLLKKEEFANAIKEENE